MARHGGHASDSRNSYAGSSTVFSGPIHVGALIADYGGWLLCGPRWRSTIKLVRGVFGLLRRRQKFCSTIDPVEFLNLGWLVDSHKLYKRYRLSVKSLPEVSNSMIGISPVDFVPSF